MLNLDRRARTIAKYLLGNQLFSDLFENTEDFPLIYFDKILKHEFGGRWHVFSPPLSRRLIASSDRGHWQMRSSLSIAFLPRMYWDGSYEEWATQYLSMFLNEASREVENMRQSKQVVDSIFYINPFRFQ
jgi:hypothetical protein